MLTAKQESFVVAYVETGNASEAYRRAYDTGRMRPATINRNAHALVRHSKVAARIQELRGEVFDSARVQAKDVLRRLCAIAFADVTSCLKYHADGSLQLDPAALLKGPAGAAVQEVVVKSDGTVKLKLASRTQALGLLAKHLGMLDVPKLPPFEQWTPDMIRQVFGEDAQVLIEAQEAEARQEQLPAPIEAAR